MKHHTFVVIGGGSAGYAAANTARQFTDDVAIIDNSEELGGLCILKGCMPSKTLIYMAEVMHLAQHAATFGIEVPEPRPNMKKVHERKVTMIDDFKNYRQKNLLDTSKFTLYRQRGEFIDADTFQLDDGTQITADHFVVSTGSIISSPPVPGLDSVPQLLSDHVLDLDNLPESMIVLGGGIVAAELAQFLNRMGTEVTLIQRSEYILKHAGAEAASVVQQAFRDEGIALFTGTKIHAIEEIAEQGIRVSFESGGESHAVEAKHLFNALGRVPNSAGLGLDKAGVSVQKNGLIQADPFLVTTNPKVYAAGDVTGPDAVVHTAVKQGETAALHAFGQTPKPMDYSCPFDVIFTDPQIGRIGPQEHELREQGYDVISADYPFDDHGKSILMEANYGYVKIWADRKTGKLLAAECVGKDGGELVHALSLPVQLGLTLKDIKGIYWYHPTLSEIWEYPIDDLYDAIYDSE